MPDNYRTKTVVLIFIQYAIIGLLVSLSVSAFLVVADLTFLNSSRLNFIPIIIAGLVAGILIGGWRNRRAAINQRGVEQEQISKTFIFSSVFFFVLSSLAVSTVVPLGASSGSFYYGIFMLATLLLSYVISRRFKNGE